MLLVPQAPIAWIILAILVLLEIGALLSLVRLRREMRGLARKSADRGLDAELEHAGNEYVYLASIKSGPERGVEALPAAMLIIGLMGTFVGLAFAINEAAAALHTAASTAHQLDEQIRHLSDALRTMGTKFQTSIYGIAFSLGTRTVAGLWIERERDLLASALGRRLDALRAERRATDEARAAQRAGQVSTLLNRCERLLRLDQLEVVPARLGAQVEALAQVIVSLRSAIDAVPVQLSTPIGALARTVEALEPAPAKLGAQAEVLARSAHALRASLDSFDKVASRADQFTAAADALTGAAKQLEAGTVGALGQLARSVDASTVVTRTMGDAVAKLERSGAESSERAARGTEGVTAAAQALTAATGKLEGAVVTSLGGFEKSTAEGAAALRAALKAFDKASARAESFTQATAAIADATASFEKSTAALLDRIAGKLSQDSDRSAAASAAVASSLGQLTDLSTALGRRLADGVAAAEAAVKDLTTATTKLEDVALESSKQVARNSQEGLDALHTALESFDGVGARSEHLVEVATSIASATARLEEASSASTGALTRELSRGVGEIASVTRSLGDGVARLERASAAAAERAVRSAEDVAAAAQRLAASTANLEGAATASLAQAARGAAQNTSSLRASLESFDAVVGRMGGFVDSTAALAGAASHLEAIVRLSSPAPAAALADARAGGDARAEPTEGVPGPGGDAS